MKDDGLIIDGMQEGANSGQGAGPKHQLEPLRPLQTKVMLHHTNTRHFARTCMLKGTQDLSLQFFLLLSKTDIC